MPRGKLAMFNPLIVYSISCLKKPFGDSSYERPFSLAPLRAVTTSTMFFPQLLLSEILFSSLTAFGKINSINLRKETKFTIMRPAKLSNSLNFHNFVRIK